MVPKLRETRPRGKRKPGSGNHATQGPFFSRSLQRKPYQYEEEDQRAEGAEDDVDGDEDGEVVELGGTLLRVALRILFLPAKPQIVDE